MSTAFDSLTSEGKSTRTLLFNYRTFMSVSGLAPPHAVGMLVHQPGGLTPGHSIGISPKWSYYVESDYAPADGVVAASSVRSQYLTAQASAANAIQLQYASTLADAALASPKSSENTKDAEKLRAEVAQLLSVTGCPASCDHDSLMKAKDTFDKQLHPAKDDAQKEAKKLDGLVSGKNIVITRWSGGETNAANISAANIGNANGSEKKSLSGIAIFTGLHTRFLFAGEDLLDMAREFVSDKSPQAHLATAGILTATGITTYVVMAEQVEYISDQELEQRASLGVSLPLSSIMAMGSLKKFAQSLPTDTNISLGISHQVVSSLGNSGHLAKPINHVKGFSFYPPQVHAAFVVQQAVRDKNYITVFAVRTELNMLETIFSSAATDTDFMRLVKAPSCAGEKDCDENRKYRKLGLLLVSKEAYVANEADNSPESNLKTAWSPDKSWYFPVDASEFYRLKGKAACDKYKKDKEPQPEPGWYGVYCVESSESGTAKPQ